mgnify:CR=1 FL=1|tara:strand:- start:676 stop:987 length:312 start_codon:yes stop_codon:yes gene_type:complete
MTSSFPRLFSLDAETSANYKRASKMTKKVLLAQIYQLQNDLDASRGNVAYLEAKAESQSLKDWSDVINRSRSLANDRAKKDMKQTWKDLKTIFSSPSFTISKA